MSQQRLKKFKLGGPILPIFSPFIWRGYFVSKKIFGIGNLKYKNFGCRNQKSVLGNMRA